LARRREARLLALGDYRSFFEFEAAAAAETAELTAAETAEPMPTTLSGFETHQRYVLERHLKRWEVLKVPRKLLGTFKGECVYDRSGVEEGATARQWLQRHGRQVKQGELPCRVVEGKGKGGKEKGKDGEEGGREGGREGKALELFGFWQTERYQPPALLPGGELPVNEHGNIEVWGRNRIFLPKGTRHVYGEGGREWEVARQLGIRYARAVTGWEMRQGRTLPVVEGVVVKEQDAGVLRDGCRSWQAGREEKIARAKERKVVERWGRLVKGLRIARELQEKYGGENRKGGTVGRGTW
jgi:xeroderma pigmentosum group C-complementing protein